MVWVVVFGLALVVAVEDEIEVEVSFLVAAAVSAVVLVVEIGVRNEVVAGSTLLEVESVRRPFVYQIECENETEG